MKLSKQIYSQQNQSKNSGTANPLVVTQLNIQIINGDGRGELYIGHIAIAIAIAIAIYSGNTLFLNFPLYGKKTIS